MASAKWMSDNNLTEIVETSNIVKNAEGAEADGVKLDTEFTCFYEYVGIGTGVPENAGKWFSIFF